MVASHARRMALTDKVDGLGYWMAFGSDGAKRDAPPPEREDEGDFVGLMMLPPAHGPDQPDDPTVCDLGYRLVRRYWRQGLASEASRVCCGTPSMPSGRAGSSHRPWPRTPALGA